MEGMMIVGIIINEFPGFKQTLHHGGARELANWQLLDLRKRPGTSIKEVGFIDRAIRKLKAGNRSVFIFQGYLWVSLTC
jgi:hypothetical protein